MNIRTLIIMLFLWNMYISALNHEHTFQNLFWKISRMQSYRENIYTYHLDLLIYWSICFTWLFFCSIIFDQLQTDISLMVFLYTSMGIKTFSYITTISSSHLEISGVIAYRCPSLCPSKKFIKCFPNLFWEWEAY